jgi:hypothetical protein
MSFDPIQESRNKKFTREELKAFWQGPGRIVQQVRTENPQLYFELHSEAERHGLIGKSLAPSPAPNTPYRPPVKTYTPAELKLRGDFSEDYCRQLFASGSSKEAAELFKTDRERYEDAKDASISFNILPARLTPRPLPPPAPEPEYLQRISDELAAESGLPPGTSVPWPQFEQLIEQKLARARKVQADAESKVAADRQAEIEKLTAKQQADQDELDQKQKDADRLAALLVPRQNEVPDPAIALGRAVAQERERAKAVEGK